MKWKVREGYKKERGRESDKKQRLREVKKKKNQIEIEKGRELQKRKRRKKQRENVFQIIKTMIYSCLNFKKWDFERDNVHKTSKIV